MNDLERKLALSIVQIMQKNKKKTLFHFLFGASAV